MDRSPTVLLVAVLMGGAVAFLSTFGARDAEVAQRELAFGFAVRVVGGLVSVVGLVGVLGQWYAGAGVARLAAGGVVVLAGVVVASQSWAAAVALAGVLVAALAFPRGPSPGSGPDAAPTRPAS